MNNTPDTKPIDLGSLSALSDEALDIEVAKAQGHVMYWDDGYARLFFPSGAHTDKYPAKDEGRAWKLAYKKHFSKPSTDANAALLLLEETELVFEPFITPKGTNLTVWNKREWFEGKPSVALPRAITIAYILFKQQQ